MASMNLDPSDTPPSSFPPSLLRVLPLIPSSSLPVTRRALMRRPRRKSDPPRQITHRGWLAAHISLPCKSAVKSSPGRALPFTLELDSARAEPGRGAAVASGSLRDRSTWRAPRSLMRLPMTGVSKSMSCGCSLTAVRRVEISCSAKAGSNASSLLCVSHATTSGARAENAAAAAPVTSLASASAAFSSPASLFSRSTLPSRSSSTRVTFPAASSTSSSSQHWYQRASSM
mmetsp:Transcript_3683/g.8876  ORF Transcript_3683/g.8876 Transcript_3683/m.8876 type:complete len:230 (+) Transcript_3683:139-828(+)